MVDAGFGSPVSFGSASSTTGLEARYLHQLPAPATAARLERNRLPGFRGGSPRRSVGETSEMKMMRHLKAGLLAAFIILLAGAILYRVLSSHDRRTQWVANVVEASAPALRSTFFVYPEDGRLLFTSEQCSDEDLAPPIALHVFPVNTHVLPAYLRREGFEYHDFQFTEHQRSLRSWFKDVALPDHVKCAAVVELPDYGVTRIKTGQYLPGEWLWEGEIRFDLDAQRIADLVAHDRPAVRSRFNVFHDQDRLIFAGGQCGDEDVAPPFALHVFPANPDVLPAPRREEGFEYLDFQFPEHELSLGFYFDGVPLPSEVGCIAIVELPGYDVARFRTGQYLPDGWIWVEEFEVEEKAS